MRQQSNLKFIVLVFAVLVISLYFLVSFRLTTPATDKMAFALPSNKLHKSEFKLSFNIPFDRQILMVRVGTALLPAAALASIDSIARHMPDWRVEIHIPVEEGIPHDELVRRKERIAEQLEVFMNRGVIVEAVYHRNVKRLVKGTPFASLKQLEQKHIGGVYGATAHEYFGRSLSLL